MIGATVAPEGAEVGDLEGAVVLPIHTPWVSPVKLTNVHLDCAIQVDSDKSKQGHVLLAVLLVHSSRKSKHLAPVWSHKHVALFNGEVALKQATLSVSLVQFPNWE